MNQQQTPHLLQPELLHLLERQLHFYKKNQQASFHCRNTRTWGMLMDEGDVLILSTKGENGDESFFEINTHNGRLLWQENRKNGTHQCPVALLEQRLQQAVSDVLETAY